MDGIHPYCLEESALEADEEHSLPIDLNRLSVGYIQT
jgi:hypothetical protein